MKTILLGLIACLALVGIAVPADAATTYPQYYSGVEVDGLAAVGCYTLGCNPASPVSTTNPDGSSVTNTILLSIPSISTSATGALADPQAGGSVELQYQIEVVGTPGSVLIGVQATGQVQIGAFGATGYGASASASMSFDDLSFLAGCSPTYNQGCSQQQLLNTSVSLTEGTEYLVTMATTAGVVYAYDTADASVDPYFTVPAGYTIDLSPGIGNLPLTATPLPAALPLFATGLGALGLFGWRRKRKNAVALVTA
jgi:hypothetical protein